MMRTKHFSFHILPQLQRLKEIERDFGKLLINYEGFLLIKKGVGFPKSEGKIMKIGKKVS